MAGIPCIEPVERAVGAVGPVTVTGPRVTSAVGDAVTAVGVAVRRIRMSPAAHL